MRIRKQLSDEIRIPVNSQLEITNPYLCIMNHGPLDIYFDKVKRTARTIRKGYSRVAITEIYLPRDSSFYKRITTWREK